MRSERVYRARLRRCVTRPSPRTLTPRATSCTGGCLRSPAGEPLRVNRADRDSGWLLPSGVVVCRSAAVSVPAVTALCRGGARYPCAVSSAERVTWSVLPRRAPIRRIWSSCRTSSGLASSSLLDVHFCARDRRRVPSIRAIARRTRSRRQAWSHRRCSRRRPWASRPRRPQTVIHLPRAHVERTRNPRLGPRGAVEQSPISAFGGLMDLENRRHPQLRRRRRPRPRRRSHRT